MKIGQFVKDWQLAPHVKVPKGRRVGVIQKYTNVPKGHLPGYYIKFKNPPDPKRPTARIFYVDGGYIGIVKIKPTTEEQTNGSPTQGTLREAQQ